MTDLTTLSIAGLASLVRQDWKKVNYAAEPYLSAMFDLRSIHDKYGDDSGTVTVRVTARKAA